MIYNLQQTFLNIHSFCSQFSFEHPINQTPKIPSQDSLGVFWSLSLFSPAFLVMCIIYTSLDNFFLPLLVSFSRSLSSSQFYHCISSKPLFQHHEGPATAWKGRFFLREMRIKKEAKSDWTNTSDKSQKILRGLYFIPVYNSHSKTIMTLVFLQKVFIFIPQAVRRLNASLKNK